MEAAPEVKSPKFPRVVTREQVADSEDRVWKVRLRSDEEKVFKKSELLRIHGRTAQGAREDPPGARRTRAQKTGARRRRRTRAHAPTLEIDTPTLKLFGRRYSTTTPTFLSDQVYNEFQKLWARNHFRKGLSLLFDSSRLHVLLHLGRVGGRAELHYRYDKSSTRPYFQKHIRSTKRKKYSLVTQTPTQRKKNWCSSCRTVSRPTFDVSTLKLLGLRYSVTKLEILND